MTSSSINRNTATIRKYRYYPGWTMLGISAAASFMSAPGQSYSVAAFKDPMRSTLQISETNFSLAYSFATILSGISLPFVGRLIDRFGARKMLPTIALLLGTGCFLISWMSSLRGLYLGFSIVRCLGQGSLTLVATWIVGEWFEQKRGIATALAGLGGSFSVMTIPLLNDWLIRNYSWQTAWQVLGLLVWGILLLPSIIVLRDRPEELGLLPDGSDSTHVPPISKTNRQVPTKESWPVREVLWDSTFWKLLAVPATSGMVCTGMIFHQVKLLGSRGVSPSWALRLIAIQALISTCAALPAGWLTDRIQSRYLMATAMAFLASAVFMVLFMKSASFAFLYAFLLGLHDSVIRSTGSVVWINYYGRASQGAVRGIAFSVMILAAAFGPLPLALSIQFQKSYNVALVFFGLTPLIALVCVSTAKQPKRRQLREITSQEFDS